MLYILFEVIQHYKLYLLFAPMIVYNVYYFQEIARILYYFKLSNKLRVIYYPQATCSFLVNICVIFPKRVAFNHFHKPKHFSISAVLWIAAMVVLNAVVGFPIIIIRLVYLLVKTKSTTTTWYKLSIYENKLLLFENYSMLKNMKPSLWEIARAKKSMNLDSIEFFDKQKCLIKTNFYTHAAVINKYTGAYVYYTSSQQTKLGPHINFVSNSYAYGRAINDYVVICSYEKILNKSLVELLDHWGDLDCLKYHYIIAHTANHKLQTVCSSYIYKYWTEHQIKSILQFHEESANLYNQGLELRKALLVADVAERKIILFQRKHVYNSLKNYADLHEYEKDYANFATLFTEIQALVSF